MDQWEYNAIDHTAFLLLDDGPSEDSLDKMLGGFGQDGWELVCVFKVWFIFKRRKVSGTP